MFHYVTNSSLYLRYTDQVTVLHTTTRQLKAVHNKSTVCRTYKARSVCDL